MTKSWLCLQSDNRNTRFFPDRAFNQLNPGVSRYLSVSTLGSQDSERTTAFQNNFKFNVFLHCSIVIRFDIASESGVGFLLGFNISEAFPYPGITGQNWSPSREIPGYRDLTFFSKKKNNDKKTHINFNFVINSSFSPINSYLCKKKPLKS